MAFPSEAPANHFPIIPLSGSQPAAKVRTGSEGSGKVAPAAGEDTTTRQSASHPRSAASARFIPLRSNLWAIKVGYWLGRGYSAKAVADIVGDGTSEGTVKGQLRRAGLCASTPRQVVVPIEMPSWQRDAVASKATELGIALDCLLQRFIESGLVLDDLYLAVCDDRYLVQNTTSSLPGKEHTLPRNVRERG